MNDDYIQNLSPNLIRKSDSVMGEFHEAPELQEPDNFISCSAINEWVPVSEEDFKPEVGREFENLELSEKFYKTYAHHVGFSVRKSTSKKVKSTGDTKYKYFVCSKQGFKEDTNKTQKTEKVQKTKLTREGCNALAGFRRTKDGKYVLFKFYEGHTHLLVTLRKHHMLKSNKGVKSVHRTLFKSFSRANIGASKAHRLIKEQVGGFQNVGCSQQDLKNFQRDIKAFIKGYDAHMFIDNFQRKREVNPSFYFAYKLEDDGRLQHVL
ncbi:unnamed protein product [Cuscuta epithymum]|uniref:FAR1 domain-containing protein n=1 Tax=Cuscuta epithymum TaxID=186058 RepID=A0AAV0EV81_9ASTE|nr:unnamed protein product [Cuscuta epithymum]